MTTPKQFLNSVASIFPKYRHYFLAGFNLTIGLGLSTFTSLVVYNWEYKFMQTELQNHLDQLARNIEREVNSSLELIRAIGTFYSTTETQAKKDFETFVQPSIYNHPNLKVIAWAPQVLPVDRLWREEVAEFEGYPNFQIQELTNKAQRVPATDRSYFFPLYHIFPPYGNEKNLGLDIAYNPLDQKKLEMAVKRQQIIATAPQIWPTETQNSFRTFLPVFDRNIQVDSGSQVNLSPLTQENLKGFIVGVFTIDSIIKSAVQETKLEGINLSLQDIMTSETDQLIGLYEAKNQTITTRLQSGEQQSFGQLAYCPDGSACTRILNIENRRWLLQLWITPQYITLSKHWRSLATLAMGILLTTLVTAYSFRLLKYTDKIEKIAWERQIKSTELAQTLQRLKETQSQLIQTEKMSSLGLLVAGVAHEINNPVNFIYGNLHHTHEYAKDLLKLVELYQEHYPQPHPEVLEYSEMIELEFMKDDLPKILSSMKMGTDRILKIVQSLRNFSRLDESDMKLVNIHEGIDSTLLILKNRLKEQPNYPPISVIKKYGNLPLVECYPGQLNQVFLNIISNAIDALQSYNLERSYPENVEKPGQIWIRTEQTESNQIVIRIADNGPGITESIQQRLFDPFFTTKPVGKGTGLGLSISYQIIVEKHQGSLQCQSIPIGGTEFRIEIPLRQSESSATPVVSLLRGQTAC